MVYKAGNSCPNIGAFIGQAEHRGASTSRILRLCFTSNVSNSEVILAIHDHVHLGSPLVGDLACISVADHEIHEECPRFGGYLNLGVPQSANLCHTSPIAYSMQCGGYLSGVGLCGSGLAIGLLSRSISTTVSTSETASSTSYVPLDGFGYYYLEAWAVIVPDCGIHALQRELGVVDW